MDNWNNNQMTPFDQRTSANSLVVLKLLIPYLPPHTQKMFAIYIKFLEFQHTISSFQSFRQRAYSTQNIFEDLKPYIPPSTSETLDQILNMISMMQLFQEMNQTAGDESEFDPMAMMKNMLSPEQQSMFEMYNDMFANNDTLNNTKGGDTSA